MGKKDKLDRFKQKQKHGGSLSLFVIGAALLIAALARHNGLESGMALGGMICLGLGAADFLRGIPILGRPLPKKEVMKLAEARNGLLTLSETATALDIDPALAEKTLKALSKSGIAHQRWEEYRKNLWEFPDYIKLPISETIDRAKQNGGRISLHDLLASGHSLETATQTLDTLSQKGLAHQDPAAPPRTLILTTQ